MLHNKCSIFSHRSLKAWAIAVSPSVPKTFKLCKAGRFAVRNLTNSSYEVVSFLR